MSLSHALTFIRLSLGAAAASSLLLITSISGAALLDNGRRPAQPGPAIDGVLEASRSVPLVVMGEAHGLQQQHDLLLSLIRDPRFPERFDDIVVEFGNGLYQDVLDRYIAGEAVPLRDLQQVWRNHTVSPMQPWDSPVYQRFFETVRQINAGLPAADRIRVVAGDPPIDWSTVSSGQEVAWWRGERSRYLAQAAVGQVLAKDRRGLLIAGLAHVVRRSADQPGLPAALNAVQLIEQQYPGASRVIVPHTGFGAGTADLEARMSSWPAPSITAVEGTWLGQLPGRLLFSDMVLTGPPGSGPPPDPWAGLEVGDLVDAYLYLGLRERLVLAAASPLLMRDDEYFNTLNLRSLLVRGVPLMPVPQYYAYGFPPPPQPAPGPAADDKRP